MLDPATPDRRRGAILGAVLGDAFGAPLEGAAAGVPLRQLRQRALAATSWGFSDDSLLFIAVAESIRDCGSVIPEELLRAFARHYEPARGFGRGMKLAIQAFEAGVPWPQIAHTAWPEGSRGNGGAVRAGAIALRQWRTTEDLLAATIQATRITHVHPEAIDCALLQARLVSVALNEPEALAIPTQALQLIARDLPQTQFLREVLQKIAELTAASDAVDIAAAFGTSPLACESVPAAVTAFLRSRETFVDAVVTAARLGGDTDSICALVGCLAGALHGARGIPATWLHTVAHEYPSVDELLRLADGVGDMQPIGFAQ